MAGTNERQALVADVGGTHARLAIADLSDLAIRHFAKFRCAEFSSLQEVIGQYLDAVPERPPLAGIAIAGPVTDRLLRLTNLPWSFTREEIRAVVGVQHLHVLNDFAALALSLPHLTANDLQVVHEGEPVASATKAVLGPGTGLGVAALACSPSGWVVIPTEGGHVSFPIDTADELAIVDQVRNDAGYVSAERLISGPGLTRLYEILARRRGEDAQPLSAPDIVARGMARQHPLAEDTLRLFVRWLGRFAGDVTLIYGARGGVYLGGGIAPRILDLIASEIFRTAFLDKGRVSSFLERIQVAVIKADDAGLRGAAVALAASLPPQRSGC